MSESTLTEPATIELIISTSVKFLTHLSNTFNEKNKLKNLKKRHISVIKKI